MATEFCRRTGATLSALFWPGKKKKGRGPPLLGWRGERGEEKSSSGGEHGEEEPPAAGEAGEESSGEREREKERDERLTGGAHRGKPPPHSVGGDLSGFES